MTRQKTEAQKTARMRRRLLAWYDTNRRDLPWRKTRDPYAIWVSEIMLQQTRVAVVIDRYRSFLSRFPTLSELAAAPEQDVLALWSGLGYYRRARMLHKAAQFVVAEREGKMPAHAKELRLLPGIGSYTAAAIASIAHGEHIAVVDGNVERVICRLRGWQQSVGTSATTLRRKVEAAADKLVDPQRPGDFNQAMMELGAMVCLPRNPHCLVCPLAPDCFTRGEHKTQPRPRMQSREAGCALVLRNREVLLEQRPDSNTVMPGLWQLPVLRDAAILDAELRMTVRHAIMQINYIVRVRNVEERDLDKLTIHEGRRRWVPLVRAAEMALTGLTRKILTRAHLFHAAPAQAVAPEPTADVP